MRYILVVAGNQQFETIKKRIVEVAPKAEDIMMTAGQALKAEGKTEGKAEGKTEGKAEGILTVLEARGIDVTVEQRERIFACKDLAELDGWLRRVATVGAAEELFG